MFYRDHMYLRYFGLASWFLPGLVIAVISVSARGQVTLDGSVGSGVAGPLDTIVTLEFPNGRYDVGPNLGTVTQTGVDGAQGLIHSFGKFSLRDGQGAVFTGPDSITHVIARVTGGLPSMIDGTLRSEIVGADFFFVNPAGVMFGPNAQLDVSGSFVVTMADKVSLGDNGVLSVSTDPDDSVLTSAPPSAFGFLPSSSQSPGTIVIDHSTFELPAGHGLSIIGGNIEAKGAQISVAAGHLNLISARSAVQVDYDAVMHTAEIEPGQSILLGDIKIHENSQFSVVVEDVEAGHITVRAHDFSITEGSLIQSRTFGAANGGPIQIVLRGDLIATSGNINSESFDSGSAGNISIVAANILAKGDPGSAGIGSFSFGSGNAGNVHVQTSYLELMRASGLGSLSLNSGHSGMVEIFAQEINLDGQGFETVFEPEPVGTGITAAAFRSGNGGLIRIETDILSVFEGAVITSATLGSGVSGSIEVTAEKILLDGRDFVPDPNQLRSTGIGSPSFGITPTSNAGTTVIRSVELTILRGALISSSTFELGSGGDIQIEAQSITIDRFGMPFRTGITAFTTGPGRGGTIQIGSEEHRVSDIRLLGGGEVSVFSVDTGRGGNISLFGQDNLVSRPRLNFDDAGGVFPMVGINPFYHGDASWLKDERRRNIG